MPGEDVFAFEVDSTACVAAEDVLLHRGQARRGALARIGASELDRVLLGSDSNVLSGTLRPLFAFDSSQ
jgi:hypothetical protein